MAKNSNELHQRAAAKRAPVLSTTVHEANDGVEQRLLRIPTVQPEKIPPPGLAATPPNAANFKPSTGDEMTAKDDPASGAVSGKSNETPHVHEETDKAREARLDKQWKQLKVDVGDLPDVYARLSKFKLTGSECSATYRKGAFMESALWMTFPVYYQQCGLNLLNSHM